MLRARAHLADVAELRPRCLMPLSRHPGRSCRLLLSVAVAAWIGACRAYSPPPDPELSYRANDAVASRAIYWRALERLDLERAHRVAPDEEHRGFIEALRLTLAGEMHQAEEGLRLASRSATDSVLRQVARTTLVSVLTYQGDWDALNELARADAAIAGARPQDRAGVLAWSEVMRGTPPPRIPRLNSPHTGLMHLSPTGVPVVTVEINGCTKSFWLDTGSSTTLVASDVAAACGVTPVVADTLEMITTTGRVPARPAVVGTLRFAGVTAHDVPAAIISQQELQLNRLASFGSTAPVGIDGVVGFDFLRQFDVELDYGRSRVTLRPAGSLGGRPEERNFYWLGYPVVRMLDIHGKPTFFGLDTGADESFVTPGLMARLPPAFHTRERRHIAGFGGDTTEVVPIVAFLQLRISRQYLFFTGLVVREQRRLLFLDVDGVLGADVGGLGKVRFDMASGRLVVGDRP
ncbi:MAG TPA: aspartyl protease family protein [Gemmatimonadaceae bacterium]|nr:aspartyl protease family protein [Gemmatimonadaceae bacterium]